MLSTWFMVMACHSQELYIVADFIPLKKVSFALVVNQFGQIVGLLFFNSSIVDL